METIKTCTVCGKPVDASRLASYPSARTCGVPACAKEHGRVQVNRHRKNYLHRRAAADPQREIERRRERYVLERLRLGKTPAVRAPVAHERGPIGTFFSGMVSNVVTALFAPVTLVRGLLRRRRERKEHRAWMIVLTRQGRGPDGVKFRKLRNIREG